MPVVAPKIKVIRVDILRPSSGTTIANTTNLIKGDGVGNGVNSGIDPAKVVIQDNTQPTPNTINDIISLLQHYNLCA